MAIFVGVEGELRPGGLRMRMGVPVRLRSGTIGGSWATPAAHPAEDSDASEDIFELMRDPAARRIAQHRARARAILGRGDVAPTKGLAPTSRR